MISVPPAGREFALAGRLGAPGSLTVIDALGPVLADRVA
jgi:hypothetical protein